MPSFKIPDSSRKALQNLISLSEPDFAALLDGLSQAAPSLDKEYFWEHVSPYAKSIDPIVVEQIVDEVFVMESAMRDSYQEAAEFAKEAAASLLETQNFNADECAILRDRIEKIFSGRKGLSITTKARGILLDQNHVFYTAKILTDVRPVFSEDGKSVDAAVIVHNLHIHYGKEGNHKDFYVALDTIDIGVLRGLLDRADEKAKCLQALIKKADGVSYLDVGE